MTGVLNAMAASGNPWRYTVTIGNSSSFYGLGSLGSYGAISSTSFRGATIDNVNSNASASPNDIVLVIQTALPQNFFGILEVQDTTGAYRRYTSASATFSTFGSSPVLSQWVWDNNNPVWTSTSPGSRILVLY